MRLRKSARFLLYLFMVVLVVVVGLNTVDLGVRDTPFGAVCLCGWGRTSFDADEWNAADGDVGPLWSHGAVWDTRWAKMVEDVTAHRLRSGMSSKEVSALLGCAPSGGDGYERYPLLAFPRVDQRLVARMLFGSWNPDLVVKYSGKEAPKLVGWEIQ